MKHKLRSSPKNVRKRLIGHSQKGGITLVLGAGVSLSCGVPSWGELVARVWKRIHPRKAPPSWLFLEEELRAKQAEARVLLTETFGKRFAKTMSLDVPEPHPLAYQIVLEELEHELRKKSSKRAAAESNDEANPIAKAKESLTRKLTQALYAGVREPEAMDSVGIIARHLRKDQRRNRRHIQRVITFNADDLLEAAANAGHSPGRDPVVWPVSRASYHPRRSPCANGRSPITIYHLHGFLPRPKSKRSLGKRGAPDTLVFTDAQYWQSVSNPSSFANRVIGHSMQDSHCVFIGLSMTDVNLMRWLGMRYCEVENDKLSQQLVRGKSPLEAASAVQDTLRRHYWIRTDEADPSNFISAHLERRGVAPVVLPTWGDFETLMDECFDG